jgi:hypothetical protein
MQASQRPKKDKSAERRYINISALSYSLNLQPEKIFYMEYPSTECFRVLALFRRWLGFAPSSASGNYVAVSIRLPPVPFRSSYS